MRSRCSSATAVGSGARWSRRGGSRRRRPSHSVQVWRAVTLLGLELVARGRLFPGLTDTGADTWRAGPLDVDDEARLARLVAAMPPHGHATAAAPARGPTASGREALRLE